MLVLPRGCSHVLPDVAPNGSEAPLLRPPAAARGVGRAVQKPVQLAGIHLLHSLLDVSIVAYPKPGRATRGPHGTGGRPPSLERRPAGRAWRSGWMDT